MIETLVDVLALPRGDREDTKTAWAITLTLLMVGSQGSQVVCLSARAFDPELTQVRAVNAQFCPHHTSREPNSPCNC